MKYKSIVVAWKFLLRYKTYIINNKTMRKILFTLLMFPLIMGTYARDYRVTNTKSDPVMVSGIEVKETTMVENLSVSDQTEQLNNRFSIRTNLLYDAFLLPSLGVEWRVNECWSVKLDGSYSFWGDEKSEVQKIWLLNPEVRHYMGEAKRFYVGVSGNYGEYNIYKGMLGNLISKDTGYQGTLWNAGLTAGYQLPLTCNLSLDFNIGLGYGQFKYDSFDVQNEVRIYKEKDQTKNRFAPTQAGISLVWRIGK